VYFPFLNFDWKAWLQLLFFFTTIKNKYVYALEICKFKTTAPYCPQNLSFLGPRFERPRTQRHETSIWKLKENQARENFL
jgi:hypothetical protein